MEQQKLNGLIIGFVGILLVILGVFYYKNKANDIPVEEEKVTIEDTSTPATPLTKEEEAKKKADLANAEELKAQEAVKKAKWNTAIVNARTATGKGEYDKAIAFYNEALSYYKNDVVYYGLFMVYSAQNDINKAQVAIETAIKLNPSFTELWNTKLTFLDEKTQISFPELKRIYEEGLTKADPKTKINLVTIFAGIAEKNGQKAEAITVWEYAQKLYPENSAIYQTEIDRLKAI